MTCHARPIAARLTIGLLIVALGVALLLDRAGVIDAFGRSSFWPFVIICVGLVKLANRPAHGPRQGGWWVFFGVLLLLNDHARVAVPGLVAALPRGDRHQHRVEFDRAASTAYTRESGVADGPASRNPDHAAARLRPAPRHDWRDVHAGQPSHPARQTVPPVLAARVRGGRRRADRTGQDVRRHGGRRHLDLRGRR